MTAIGWLALYLLAGAATGFLLSASRQGFTKPNQVVGALLWPVVLLIFAWSFLRAFVSDRRAGGG